MDLLAVIDPVAVQIGPLTIRWYGIIIVSAIMLAIWLGDRFARDRGLNAEFVTDLAMVIVPAGILGARLYEVFFLQWPYYSQHPEKILAIWEGGLAIHGALLGGAIAGGIFMRFRRQPFWPWADVAAVVLPLAQAIGRWGNFFNQEAYGDPAPQWLVDLMPGWLREGMTISGTVMHPTFLYESLWNLLAFAALLWFHRRRPTPGVLMSLYLILYNTGRFLIESIRQDSSFIFGWIRVAQLAAVLLILLGFGLLIYHLRRNPSPDEVGH
ncbi:phosphatidylglycerol:prolipoprotein diacylglycerol transferase [Symbiobacterium terraclitae]|uniref:Phosphatidylglycerol--prolipoprotein diacylglyceryl transferase n=2 Tax=Symbiobacterium terraclitae TaxID=557451 RepID=A0ABS4JWL1_9FIRM|nr:prolipoprotein diacylglyceryl transferase [Symbiobacterium terraclitae]MBP2019917.1 phosphatidylglycerol:prolipoprotein diacylglycerol transferase [Symbiobacterium terraclitae]